MTKLVERFEMQDWKPIKNPTAMNFKKELNSSGYLLSETERQIFQSLIGSLMRAMIGTRPGIAFSIQDLSKFVSKSCRKHLDAVKK